MPTKSTTSSVNRKVADKIVRASELPKHARILVYGRSGAGKTRLASSAPDVLVVDVNEQGTDSVRRDFNPYVYPLSTWTELQDVFWYLESGDHEYKSVAVDGITAMQALCMKFVLGDERSRDASRDPDMPTRQIYGKVGELMKTQITNFRNLPMNVIFTALQRSRDAGDDEESGEIYYSPGCSPGIAGHLEQAVSLIGHLGHKRVRVRVKGKEGEKPKVVTRVRRELLVGESERYMTKDRYYIFGDVVENPNLTDMLNAVEEAR